VWVDRILQLLVCKNDCNSGTEEAIGFKQNQAASWSKTFTVIPTIKSLSND